MPVVILDGKVYVVTDIAELSGTDAVTLYACMPPYNKYVLRKLYIYNPDSSDHVVEVGEYDTIGTSWESTKIRVPVSAGQSVTLGPDDLPADFVMTTDPETAILAWAARLQAAVAANNVQVKAEFEIA